MEGNHYTVCPWKGVASYYDVAVDGEVNRDAAWYYPKPTPPARKVADRVAFWNGVKPTPRPLPSATDYFYTWPVKIRPTQ